MPMENRNIPTTGIEIAKAIKDAAGWKCEECGVEHNTYIVRLRTNPRQYRYITEAQAQDEYALYSTHVVLTVHHVGVEKPDGTPGDPDDKMDCRRENLKCLCQRCHLLADQELHLKKASATRATNKRESQLEAGQGELF